MTDPSSIDATLLAGLIGAGGSIAGALAGTLLGFKLSNRKAKLGIFIDNTICAYYTGPNFCMYVPITVTNEGNQSATITTFEARLISPTKQVWSLYWSNFAENNSHKGEGWVDGKAANPVLVHGNSGTQHYIKLANFGQTSDGLSDVALTTGEYKLEFLAYGRNKKLLDKTQYYFSVMTEPQELLAQRRKNLEDRQSWWFPLYDEPLPA